MLVLDTDPWWSTKGAHRPGESRSIEGTTACGGEPYGTTIM